MNDEDTKTSLCLPDDPEAGTYLTCAYAGAVLRAVHLDQQDSPERPAADMRQAVKRRLGAAPLLRNSVT